MTTRTRSMEKENGLPGHAVICFHLYCKTLCLSLRYISDISQELITEAQIIHQDCYYLELKQKYFELFNQCKQTEHQQL